jgi:putative ABC transport system permease protein
VWQERVPHRPFEYHFLDDTYNTLYHTERQTSRIFTTFAGLAIILACLGLFALAAYTTVQRAKEIGIRKVLGADAVQIVLLVTRDSLGQVVLASLIAFPIAWYFMNRWLQSFAYRIQISWLVFAWAALGTAAVALASIGYQAIKAARANPIESLRSE